ncbi:ABC transporter permease [Actinomycetospora termitidis]|uniref:ABC transporter permease n=1 Tax=Actinomycetospora termitidis TaxID=3053470 RepID=A0ABT7MAM9_9PSEU|nr:ABC transporter permease [Actinomycetospora sp. Odt1-22]MDL5156478.1 ABC transporter permease [Actinomycetospora sp. Odt1-22]
MIGLALRRSALIPLVLLVASAVVFCLSRLLGGNVTRSVIRSRSLASAPDPAAEARLAAELGLDRPLRDQYLAWLAGAVRGDLGRSFTTRAAVGPEVLGAAGVSATLAILGLAVALAVAVPAGVLAADRPGGAGDRAVDRLGAVVLAVPEFVVGPVLVLVVAVWAGWLPALGWGTPAQAVLPVVTLAFFPAALAARLVRAETRVALAHPSTTTAVAKGLTRRRVLAVHVLPRSLTAVLAEAGPFLAGTLGGAVVVEVVFDVPGLGRLLADAIGSRDLPTIQAGLVVVLAVALVLTLATELLGRALDPRLR